MIFFLLGGLLYAYFILLPHETWGSTQPKKDDTNEKRIRMV